MRILKLIACTLVVAGMAVAQQPSSSSPSSSPASSQDATAQQAPAQPVSPLEEPKKPSDAETNKADQQKTSTFDVSNAAGGGQDTELGEVRLMTRHTDIGGDTTRSFRAPGENNLAEFNWFMDRRFLVTRRMQVLSMYRGTDDRSIDPEHNSLQKAYVRIWGQKDEYIFGDTLVNFSRLSFNQNVKGVYGSWKVSDDWKLSTFGGAFVDRYGSFYKDLCQDQQTDPATGKVVASAVVHNCIPGRPYTAIVAGGRLERKLFRDSTIGLNISSSDDRQDTLPAGSDPTQVGVAPFPASNKLASLDTKLQLSGLRMEGEFAYSLTDFDTRSFLNCPAPCDSRMPQPGLSYQSDWGARWETSWRYHKFNLRGSYVRYQPNFASMNARQIADLQDAMIRASYELTDWMTIDGTMRRSNNDLRGQLPFETRLLGPEAKLTFHDLPFYRAALFEVGYRERLVDASTGGNIERFVRIPYAEITLPAHHNTFFTLGYERRQAVDKFDPSQTSNTDHPYAALRGVYDLGGWHFNPSFRFELERQAQRPRLSDTSAISFLEFLLDRNSNRLDMASLYIETPKWFILEGAFRAATATISSMCGPTNAGCLNTAGARTYLVPSGYSRPSYRAAISYKLRNDENTTFVFSFERNSNFYFAPSPSFDERVFGFSFIYKFGKHAQTK
jgi:hypothetical protein